MKKAVFVSLILFSSFLLFSKGVVHAQMGSMMNTGDEEAEVNTNGGHAESVETVLRDILNRQNVSTVQELDLSIISDDEWERLGDAVMEVQHPGEAHEMMDRMMGGEGSESLRQMHINMGKAYLDYGGSKYGPGMMMGGGMMGRGVTNDANNRFDSDDSERFPMMGFSGMMGAGMSATYGVLGAITWIALIAFLAAGAYFFIKRAKK